MIKANMRDNEISQGLIAGCCTVTGKEVHLPYNCLPQHVSICGATGSGTSILSDSLIKQQIDNGGGLLFINGGLANKELEKIYQYACSAGREAEFLVINPTDPDLSNSYNPILFGDSHDISSRIIQSLINTKHGQTVADHFRASAQQALETLIAVFQRLGKPYNIDDLVSVLMHEQALMEVERRLHEDHHEADETTQFSALLNRYKTAKGFDMEKFKETLGGIASRLQQISTSNFGRTINTYNPEVNIEECILQNKILFINMPIISDKEVTIALAKLIVADCRSAISRLQNRPVVDLPNPPFMLHPNNCAPYMDTSWSRLFEQARTSRIFMTPLFQTLSELQPLGDKTLSEIVMGNTYFKFFFKQLSLESAKESADQIGMCIQTEVVNGKITQCSEESYIVNPEQFRSIPVGECLLLVGGKDLYRLRLPYPTSPDSTQENKPIALNHCYKDEVAGLNLGEAVREFMIG